MWKKLRWPPALTCPGWKDVTFLVSCHIKSYWPGIFHFKGYQVLCFPPHMPNRTVRAHFALVKCHSSILFWTLPSYFQSPRLGPSALMRDHLPSDFILPVTKKHIWVEESTNPRDPQACKPVWALNGKCKTQQPFTASFATMDIM